MTRLGKEGTISLVTKSAASSYTRKEEIYVTWS